VSDHEASIVLPCHSSIVALIVFPESEIDAPQIADVPENSSEDDIRGRRQAALAEKTRDSSNTITSTPKITVFFKFFINNTSLLTVPLI
jgi:hypothetical protein